jgi:hypothetical protein
MNPPTLEREFTLHSVRHHLPLMPRDLLEGQYLILLEDYLVLRDAIEQEADRRRRKPHG